MNSLADISHEEYKKLLGYRSEMRSDGLLKDSPFKNKKEGFMYGDEDVNDLPTDVDWRDNNAVTAVKNQGYCGSCWAFSTTGSVEGANAIFTKELVSLSEQELVDCDTQQDQGCNGGLMDYAFEFIIENGGLDTEKDYPYDAEQERCNLKKEKKHVVSIDSYQDVPENSEKDLQKVAANQPVSVAIDAGSRSFQLYGGGVFGGACGTQLNHGVLVVGYGTQKPKDSLSSSQDYWIVKNSWGPSWGDSGYIKMKRNVGKYGLCGIAMAASYPIKTSPNPAPGPQPAPTPDTPAPTPGGHSNECNEIFKCEEGQTCCCLEDFMGFCFNFGCCPYDDAVCCDDKEHCCPSDHPVCSPKRGTCAAANNLENTIPIGSKQPAKVKPFEYIANKVVELARH